MKLQPLALAITLGGLSHQAIAAGFIDDSKASLNLRNFYFNSDNRESQGNVGNAAYASQAKEWGQGLQLNVISGFTQGTVGFGLDAIAMTGLKLDSGGRVGKAGIERTPGALFPVDSEGHAVDEYSKGGVTGKVRISKTEARLGTLQPKLPVINFNDGRLLPQTFEGGQVTSSEIDGLTLTAGQLQSTKTRSSTDDVDLRISGATRPAGTPASTALADSDSFVFAGGDYKISKDLTAQYYYGSLEDFYQQHFLGLIHTLAIGPGALKTDLRYFNSSADGKNGNAAGRAQGYKSSGFWRAGDTHVGEVDNNTWSALFTYSLSGHAFSAGYQQVSGDSAFPFVNQGDGATAYLITDRRSASSSVPASAPGWPSMGMTSSCLACRDSRPWSLISVATTSIPPPVIAKSGSATCASTTRCKAARSRGWAFPGVTPACVAMPAATWMKTA